MNWQDELVGRVVTSIELSDDKTTLLLRTTTGVVMVEAQGNCCSESWFYHSTGIQALIGNTITAADRVDMPDPPVDDEPARQESRRYYEVRLTTEKGTVTFEMRNDSNGYYGGYVVCHEIPEEKSHASVWCPLLEDF